MCCRLHNTSAWTCWFCTDSLLNTPITLPSTQFVPILSTAWASLSVRQIHTFEDSDTPREKSFTNECIVTNVRRYSNKSLVRDLVKIFIWSWAQKHTVKINLWINKKEKEEKNKRAYPFCPALWWALLSSECWLKDLESVFESRSLLVSPSWTGFPAHGFPLCLRKSSKGKKKIGSI